MISPKIESFEFNALVCVTCNTCELAGPLGASFNRMVSNGKLAWSVHLKKYSLASHLSF